jgi:hypothetical protein
LCATTSGANCVHLPAMWYRAGGPRHRSDGAPLGSTFATTMCLLPDGLSGSVGGYWARTVEGTDSGTRTAEPGDRQPWMGQGDERHRLIN